MTTLEKVDEIEKILRDKNGNKLKRITDIVEAVEAKDLKWIPVTKGLPKEGARVLISLKINSIRKVVKSATYYGEGCFHSDTGDFWNIQEDIELLAWQPLPKSYEEDEE